MSTQTKTEMKLVYNRHSINQNNQSLRIEIYVGIDREFTEAEKQQFMRAGTGIAEVIQQEDYRLNDKYRAAGEEETRKLIELFGERKIFVEHIKNEYWPDDIHNPWLIVTTIKGRIKIGWRKRVINIDWTDSVVSDLPDQLFPEEDVSKGNYTTERYIHARGYDKAKQYIDKILAG